MLLKIDQLQKGDEFLVTSNGSFRYWKALEDPKPMKMKNQPTGAGYTRYSGLLCSCKMTATQHTQQGWGGRPPTIYTSKVYECTPFEHNHRERLNLNWKPVWLVRREEL